MTLVRPQNALLLRESFRRRQLRERRLVTARLVSELGQKEVRMNAGIDANTITQIVAAGSVEACHGGWLSRLHVPA